ncbi:MAG: hypothetical protein EAY75_01470 [Bacteroidetes bacterium]|nr:MAG: hypothetical protein EAY75_01470 [Bacteroidota bacterium]
MIMYRLIFIAFLLSCGLNSNRKKPDHGCDKQEQNNVDTSAVPSNQKSNCFLRLKTNTIKVKNKALFNCYGNVVIRYDIQGSKVKGDVQILHLYIFQKSDNKAVFNSGSGSLDKKKELVNAICAEAKRNLEGASLSCKGSNVVSWGSIAMRISFML